jgi:hypothetical protein
MGHSKDSPMPNAQCPMPQVGGARTLRTNSWGWSFPPTSNELIFRQDFRYLQYLLKKLLNIFVI